MSDAPADPAVPPADPNPRELQFFPRFVVYGLGVWLVVAGASVTNGPPDQGVGRACCVWPSIVFFAACVFGLVCAGGAGRLATPANGRRYLIACVELVAAGLLLLADAGLIVRVALSEAALRRYAENPQLARDFRGPGRIGLMWVLSCHTQEGGAVSFTTAHSFKSEPAPAIVYIPDGATAEEPSSTVFGPVAEIIRAPGTAAPPEPARTKPRPTQPLPPLPAGYRRLFGNWYAFQ